MSSNKEIGTPFTLASLPNPLGSTTGRVQAAGVCSINGTKKRKRTEIAVGQDGEGISIYSLQNPQLVTSYALPPTASFTTAPYSIYRKGSPKTPNCRYTYAFVTQSTQGEKAQLICFTEKTLKDSSDTIKTTYTPSSSAHVVAIDCLPVPAGGSAEDASHDVLVIFDNADAICLSSDLEVVRWVANLKSISSGKGDQLDIEHVSLSAAKAVTRGLLRSREDIAALLDPSMEGTSDILDLTQILCFVARKLDGSRILRLLQVQPRSPDLTTTHLPLKHLLTQDLPNPTVLSIAATPVPHYSLHAASGTVHILSDGGLISYDFSGTVPKIYSELAISDPSIDSFLRISPDLLFTTARQSCRVFDVKFNSLQALLSLEPASNTLDTATPSKKRRHEEPQSNESSKCALILVAHYADIGLVVGVRNNEIIGMQFGGTVPRKRVKTEGTLLIDALGKGISANTIAENKSLESQKWQERKVKLDRYVTKGKIAKFEETFAADLGITTYDGTESLENGNTTLTNGTGEDIVDSESMALDKADENDDEDHLRKWQLPKTIPESHKQRYRQHALYALSKIFCWVESGSQIPSRGQLKIEFFPPNVFQWLLQTGHLTKESIRRAMIEDTNKLHFVSSIADGDIVKAIVDFDSELHILSAVLNHGHFLPVGEVVQAIKYLVQGLDDQPKTESSKKLLTNGTTPAEDKMDVDIVTELEAASNEIDHALSILDHGLSIRSHALRPALIRLHTFPMPAISSTLRSMLPRRDLESLIRLLHLELKNGGWTSPYDFVDSEMSPVEASSEGPDDHAVAIIASLLGCSLDAIGAGAWLTTVGAPGSTESTEEIIQALHTDTSEALNGFWEARYMRGLLGEFLRYASNIPKSQKPSNQTLEKQNKPFVSNTNPDELPMLPLGGKVDLGIEKTKAGKGGKRAERSKREMGMLISKQVPKYSFERIVI